MDDTGMTSQVFEAAVPRARPVTAARRAGPAAAAGRRTRVLCITPLGFDGRGGIDRLYRYMRERPTEREDLDIRYVASRGQKPGLLWLPAFPWHFARIAVLLAVWRPDLVHINYANGGSLVRKLAIAALARLLGRPLMIHLHCVFPSDDVRRGRLAGRMALALARAAAHVVAIGSRAERDFLDVAGIAPDRVHVIPNGAPDIGVGLALPKRNGTVDVLFAGEIGARKGTMVLVEALGRLRDRPGWTCTVAGNGDVAACRARIEALGLAGRVRVTGWVASDVVHDLMRRADIVVLPSAREVMPMSLIEGAAAGTALLATPVGEVADLIADGENGFLIDRDPDHLAARLAALIDDPALLGRMQLASRRIYEARFGLEVFSDRLHALYGLAAGRR